MNIFESILTTFKPSIVLEAAGAVVQIGLSLKPNHHKQISLPKSVKRSLFFPYFDLVYGDARIQTSDQR